MTKQIFTITGAVVLLAWFGMLFMDAEMMDYSSWNNLNIHGKHELIKEVTSLLLAGTISICAMCQYVKGQEKVGAVVTLMGIIAVKMITS